MATLMTFVRWEISFLLAALASLVAYQILTRTITTRGLLSEVKNGVLSFSPARLQLLMFTLATAAYVLSQVMYSVANDASPQFPEINPNVLVILGGSHALYLGAKSLPSTGSNPDTPNK